MSYTNITFGAWHFWFNLKQWHKRKVYIASHLYHVYHIFEIYCFRNNILSLILKLSIIPWSCCDTTATKSVKQVSWAGSASTEEMLTLQQVVYRGTSIYWNWQNIRKNYVHTLHNLVQLIFDICKIKTNENMTNMGDLSRLCIKYDHRLHIKRRQTIGGKFVLFDYKVSKL